MKIVFELTFLPKRGKGLQLIHVIVIMNHSHFFIGDTIKIFVEPTWWYEPCTYSFTFISGIFKEKVFHLK